MVEVENKNNVTLQKFMAEHPVNTTIGAAIAVISPWGEYRNDKLINLGNNRWALRPQLGILHARNKWQFETTAVVFLYADNTEFYPGAQVREQDPLWSIQGHGVKFAYFISRTNTDTGSDLGTFQLAWSTMLGH